MALSETPSGRRWLENFASVDVPAATLLLEGLRFVSLSELSRGLKERLDSFIADGTIETPALVIPERALEDLGVPEEDRMTAVAYDDFDPEAKLDQLPGSDAFVAALARDVLRLDPDQWLRPGGGVEAMRDRRCRSIVILTDYSGSGNRIIRMAGALARNRTIRSWRSRGRIRIHAVAFAASPAADEAVAATKVVARLWAVETAPTFETGPWSPEVRSAIEDLCRTECRLAASWALGYKESAGRFLTERGAPNNLPAVLWQTSGTWKPLFPCRTVPVEVARDLEGSRPSESLSALADRVGQLRVGRNERIKNMRSASRLMLQALLLLGQRRRSRAALAAELSIDTVDTEGLLDTLQMLGFIDEQDSVTSAGRSEINAQKSGLRRTTASLSGNDNVYYPMSLR